MWVCNNLINIFNLTMSIKDKVFVTDWGQRYSDIYRWDGGVKSVIWNWKTHIPSYSEPDFYWQYFYEPNLTLKGTVNKKEPRKLISKFPKFKNFEYTIEEITQKSNTELIYLLSSQEGCWIQIGEKGISTLSITEQEKVKHLESEKRLQALAIQNLNKWSIKSNLKEFPEELLKYLYDINQTTLLGSTLTQSVIRYPYIPKEYTINGIDICLGWEQDYNGKGCDLFDKETISWNQMKQRFSEQTFN